MQPPQLKFKNLAALTVINSIVTIIFLFVLLIMLSTYLSPSSAEYHKTGTVVAMIIIALLFGFYVFITDQLRQTMKLDNSTLTFIRGQVWKHKNSFDLSKLAIVKSITINLYTGRTGAYGRALVLTDATGHTLDLGLMAFSLKHRRQLVTALRPYFDSPGVVKQDSAEEVEKTLTYFTASTTEQLFDKDNTNQPTPPSA